MTLNQLAYFQKRVRFYSKKHNELAVGDKEKGGAYVCLTQQSNIKLVDAIASHTGLNRSSIMVDIGSGTNLVNLHATIKYGCKSVGVEINESLAIAGARLWRETLSQSSVLPENYNLAVVFGDIRNMNPEGLDITHAFAFDKVFDMELMEDYLHWVRWSGAEYLICSKILTHPKATGQLITSILGSTKILHVIKNLKTHRGTETHSFAILQISEVNRTPFVEDTTNFISLKEMTRPFFSSRIDFHFEHYEAIITNYDSQNKRKPTRHLTKPKRYGAY